MSRRSSKRTDEHQARNSDDMQRNTKRKGKGLRASQGFAGLRGLTGKLEFLVSLRAVGFKRSKV